MHKIGTKMHDISLLLFYSFVPFHSRFICPCIFSIININSIYTIHIYCKRLTLIPVNISLCKASNWMGNKAFLSVCKFQMKQSSTSFAYLLVISISSPFSILAYNRPFNAVRTEIICSTLTSISCIFPFRFHS